MFSVLSPCMREVLGSGLLGPVVVGLTGFGRRIYIWECVGGIGDVREAFWRHLRP